MRNDPKDQHGLSVVSGLLILAVFAVIGVAGWYIYHVTKKLSTPYNVANQNSQTTNSSGNSNTNNNTANTTIPPVATDAQITQAVKSYKDNAPYASIAIVSITEVSGANAYGTVGFKGQDGGGQWLAHDANGTWSVVSQGSLGICKNEIQQYNLPQSWESPAC